VRLLLRSRRSQAVDAVRNRECAAAKGGFDGGEPKRD
jgi:hypothetical protein